MTNQTIQHHLIDYVELIVPAAKPVAYWHVHALGFDLKAYAGAETGAAGYASYYLVKNQIRLVITSAYPPAPGAEARDVLSFVQAHSTGVKRIALRVDSVAEAFAAAVRAGAFPVGFPRVVEDDQGRVEEASVRLYDFSEICFGNRAGYAGIFKPGYQAINTMQAGFDSGLTAIDHIAGELRVNEINFWTRYVTQVVGTRLVQSITRGEENKTGMILNINQSPDQGLTLVMAEPDGLNPHSKMQKNVEAYGAGIHHLALGTDDLIASAKALKERGVDFVKFPASYYQLLRKQEAFPGVDLEALEAEGILIDREDDGYLLQKFIKPFGDRPFFFYEMVQRVNGYRGFALKNINVLKKAEELEITKSNPLPKVAAP